MTFNRIQLGNQVKFGARAAIFFNSFFSIIIIILFSVYNVVGTTPVPFCGLSNSVFTAAI